MKEHASLFAKNSNFMSVLLVSTVLISSGCMAPDYTGLVSDTENQPLAGVTVSATNIRGEVFHTTTNSNGEYLFPGDLEISHIVADTPSHLFQRVGTVGANLVPVNNFTLVVDPKPNDSDGDGLSDGEEALVLSDPLQADTDYDSLPDGIETKLNSNFGGIGFGIDPRHQDILVEIDWIAANPATQITPLAVDMMIDAMRKSPKVNVDGTTGIHLVVDYGQLGGATALDLATEWYVAYPYTAEDDADYALHQYLDTNRQPYFFHSIAFERVFYNGNLMNGFSSFNTRINKVTGDYSQFGLLESFLEAGLLLHELGHNWQLLHGGNEDKTCKPNYPSVMNYQFITAAYALMSAITEETGLAFSNGSLPYLNEAMLDESAGVGFGPVDWNRNSQIDPVPVSANIDGLSPFEDLNQLTEVLELCDDPVIGGYLCRRCNDPVVEGEIIRDHDDWKVIVENLGRWYELNH